MRRLLLTIFILALFDGCSRQPREATPQAKAFGVAIVEIGGSKQVAGIGSALEQPVVVQVNGPQGSAVDRAAVSVRVDGSGHADPPSGLTGADGQFTTLVTLGATSGPAQVVASTLDSTGKLIELRMDEVALGYQETEGRQLGDLYCARCHNPESTPERVSNHDNLTHKPHAWNEGTVLNGMNEADLVSIIAHGGPALNRSPEMPPYGYTLNKSEIAAVIAYIRAVADPPFRTKGTAYAKN